MSKLDAAKSILTEAEQIAAQLSKATEHTAANLLSVLSEDRLTGRAMEEVRRDSLAQVASHFDIHLSTSARLHPVDSDPGELYGYKPIGLWLGRGFDWADQLNSMDSYGGARLHAFAVESDRLNILKVSTPRDLHGLIERFEDSRFSRLTKDLPSYARMTFGGVVDWRQAAKHYDGVEFSNFHKIRRNARVPIWYAGLDVDSTCIWGATDKLTVTHLGQMPSAWEGEVDSGMMDALMRMKQLKQVPK